MIELKNISKDFGSGEKAVHAVRDVSLSIGSGEIFGIIGFSGAGKSTLVRCINLLERPSSGSVFVAGQDLTALSAKDLRAARKKIGMIFQHFNLMPSRTVAGNVAYPLKGSGLSKEDIQKKVATLLELVGIGDKADAYPSQLSGGQKQRVAIAGVIAMQPRCIVMDEPTAMLDPKGRREVMETIHTLNREKGITVVLITHYMDEAAQADRVVVMDGGNIIMDDVPKKIFSQVKKLRSVGLDVPQVTELCEELREKGVDISTEIIGEQECAEALFTLTKGRSAEIPPAKEAAEDDKRPVVLECDKVTYKYSIGTPFEKTAVNSVDLKIRQGEFVGIIGHTGSGKSTLIQHFDGLVKPTSGRVLVDGADIWSKDVNIRSIRFKVGLVFQYSEHQLFEETVAKDIAYGPKNMGLSEEEIKKRVRSAAESMDIVHLLDRSPFELSGGQQQRTAIGRAIVKNPDILLCDEPTGALDYNTSKEILKLIEQVNQKYGNTIIMVTHNDAIKNMADRVVKLRDGQIRRNYLNESKVSADDLDW